MSKSFLCQTDFLSDLIELIEQNQSKKEFMRSAGLFVVNLLVKDEKVEKVFEYRDNLLLNKAIDWLKESHNEQLHVTSAVILANYMTNDENVARLLQDSREPHVRLIQLLNKYQAMCEENQLVGLQHTNVIHSLIGAMRNFCVAKESRDVLLNHQVIELMLKLIQNQNLEVKFKALSVVRFLVKNCTEKTGLDLIFSHETLKMLEEVCLNPRDHLGIKGESTRIACYLPIVAKSERRLHEFCKYNFIDIVCHQLKSDYLILVNEALLALNVIIMIAYSKLNVLISVMQE